MAEDVSITRRQLLRGSLAASSLVFLGRPQAVFAAEEAYKWVFDGTTPNLSAGPFYPLSNKPFQPGTDLTSSLGRKERAKGPLLYVMGQVLNINGAPVRDVEVEIWQANAAGRYSHPSDGNPAPLDLSFQGYGATRTDGEGRFRFKTIKPGPYPVMPGWSRAPHIHFQLTGRTDRYITQMWFPDQPLNGQDRLYTVLKASAQKMVTCQLQGAAGNLEPEANVALFNIVVANG
jgi:protocatechuate 3,4-dioxygenase, beta subunit